MTKPPGRCIFCRGFHLSKEHLFSDWLREIFPRSAHDTHTMGVMAGAPWKLSHHQGHSGSRKIRSVCISCNGGWISGIDEAAKRAATPLIRGQTTIVTSDMQRILAAWTAKIAIVVDSRDRKRSKVTQQDRNMLRETGQPSPLWQIWASSYEGTDWRDLGLAQRSGFLNFAPIAGPGEEFSGYMVGTFLGMGAVAFLVIGTDLTGMEFKVGTFAHHARRIWPAGDEFAFPIPNPLNDELALAAANIIDHMTNNFRSALPHAPT